MIVEKDTIYIGRGFDFDGTVVNFSDGSPFDLTGYTVTAYLSRSFAASRETDGIDITKVCTITDAVNGAFSGEFLGSETKDLEVGDYILEVVIDNGVDKPLTVVQEVIPVSDTLKHDLTV